MRIPFVSGRGMRGVVLGFPIPNFRGVGDGVRPSGFFSLWIWDEGMTVWTLRYGSTVGEWVSF